MGGFLFPFLKKRFKPSVLKCINLKLVSYSEVKFKISIRPPFCAVKIKLCKNLKLPPNSPY